MATTKKNPLDAFASSATGSPDFTVREMPKLGPLVKELGFNAGIAAFDDKMLEWQTALQRDIRERLQSTQPVSPGKL